MLINQWEGFIRWNWPITSLESGLFNTPISAQQGGTKSISNNWQTHTLVTCKIMALLEQSKRNFNFVFSIINILVNSLKTFFIINRWLMGLLMVGVTWKWRDIKRNKFNFIPTKGIQEQNIEIYYLDISETNFGWRFYSMVKLEKHIANIGSTVK